MKKENMNPKCSTYHEIITKIMKKEEKKKERTEIDEKTHCLEVISKQMKKPKIVTSKL